MSIFLFLFPNFIKFVYFQIQSGGILGGFASVFIEKNVCVVSRNLTNALNKVDVKEESGVLSQIQLVESCKYSCSV